MNAPRRLILGVIITGGAARTAGAETLAEASARRFPQPVRVGDLLRRRVLRPLESQPTIGRVRALVTGPSRGVVVVMDYGGVLGFFTRPIAVPVEALALLGQYMVMLGLTPQELDRLPDFAADGTVPLAEDAVIRVALAKPAH